MIILQTYDIDTQTADSAATASAMYTGVKTKMGTMGFDSSIEYADIDTMRNGKQVDNIAKFAQEQGMDTGE